MKEQSPIEMSAAETPAGSAATSSPQSNLPDSSMEELVARSETVTEVLHRFMTRPVTPLYHSISRH